MYPVTLVYPPEAEKLAARIRADLEASNIRVVGDIQRGREALLAVIIAPSYRVGDAAHQAIEAAADQHQHMIPILTDGAVLPKLIEHLMPLDFSADYSESALLEEVRRYSSPDARPPVVLRTSAVKNANQRSALFLVSIVAFMFGVAIWLIAVLGYGPPEDEFASVETQIFLTRNYYIDNALPRSTDDALNFQATVDRARPSVQPFLAATASAIAADVEVTFIPRSTAEATNFEATLRVISTVVRAELVATVTANAASAAGD